MGFTNTRREEYFSSSSLRGWVTGSLTYLAFLALGASLSSDDNDSQPCTGRFINKLFFLVICTWARESEIKMSGGNSVYF